MPTNEGDRILVQLGSAYEALFQARTIEDFKKISDIAAAAEVYARRVKLSQESIDLALEIKLRAERGLGEMLSRAPKNKGGNPKLATGNTKEPVNGAPTLEELGVTKRLSATAQKLAKVPSKTFEAKLASGERRPTAFILVKESRIPDPIGAFRHLTLAQLSKKPLEYCAELARAAVKDGQDDTLYEFNTAIMDRLSPMWDVLEESKSGRDAE